MIAHELPRADSKRIARFMLEIGEIGRDPRGGWSRLAFGPEERAAHRVFARRASELGLDVWTDAVGNTFGELRGSVPELPPLCIGSHLDTVPQGGNFDGVTGVAAGLEAAATIAAAGGARRSIRAIAFAAEEGARFGAPCIGSRLVTGAFTADTLRELVDADGRSAADCARESGLKPDEAAGAIWNPGDIGALFEVHIEQGKILETRGMRLAIVDAIAGSTRVELTFTGQANHSGGTPMPMRLDALAGAAEFVVDVERQASLHPTTVATVGRLTVLPGSITTIPGEVQLTLDVRDIDSDRQRDLAEDLLDSANRIAARRELDISAVLLSDLSPAILHKSIRSRLARAAQHLDIPFSILPSGAGHDAAQVAALFPSGMLFVPCRDGRSHVPEEWANTDDIALAVDVIVRTCLDYDEPMAHLQ